MSLRRLIWVVALFLIILLVLLSFRWLLRPDKPEIVIHQYLMGAPPNDQIALPLEIEEWKSGILESRLDGYYITRTITSDSTVVFYLFLTYHSGNISTWPDAKNGTVRLLLRGGQMPAPVYAIEVINTVLHTIELETPHGSVIILADDIPAANEAPLRVKFD